MRPLFFFRFASDYFWVPALLTQIHLSCSVYETEKVSVSASHASRSLVPLHSNFYHFAENAYRRKRPEVLDSATRGRGFRAAAPSDQAARSDLQSRSAIASSSFRPHDISPAIITISALSVTSSVQAALTHPHHVIAPAGQGSIHRLIYSLIKER